jgi:uncharacterized membrane protein HdeD (DUF308 family)
MATTSPAADPFAATLLGSLREKWWLLLLRGIAGIVFGILAYAWPIVTLLSLAILWGAYALADGIFALWASIAGPGRTGARWWLALAGVAGIVAGLVTFFLPGLTAWLLVLVIASWAIAVGVLQIVGAIALRKEIEGEWMLVLGGVVSVVLGVAILVWPLAGAVATVWTIGAFSIVFGVFHLALAFKLRRLRAG